MVVAASILLFLAVGGVPCLANHQMTMINRCGSEIWVGILGNSNPESGKSTRCILCIEDLI